MKLKVSSKDNIKQLDIYTYDVGNVINLLENDIELCDIHKVELTITYIYNTKNNINKLKNDIERFDSCVSANIKLGTVNKYTFDIIFNGKLGDVFGALRVLGLNEKFTRIDAYIKNDINLIKELLGGRQHRVDTNRSLIIKLLSECNGNLGYNTVFDILRRDFGKVELRKVLPEFFKESYGFAIENAKYQGSHNKLDLNVISDKVISDIDEEMRSALGLRRRRQRA